MALEPIDNPKDLLTTEQVMEYLGIGGGKAYTLFRHLPRYRIGNRILVLRGDVDAVADKVKCRVPLGPKPMKDWSNL